LVGTLLPAFRVNISVPSSRVEESKRNLLDWAFQIFNDNCTRPAMTQVNFDTSITVRKLTIILSRVPVNRGTFDSGHAMKACGNVETELYEFLKSASDESEWHL
jgi:hypothetical protein